MTHPLRAAFQQQARSCAALDSPFMARLCTLAGERLQPDGPLGARLFHWPDAPTATALGPAGASVPLRLAAALHALVLQGHPGLAPVWPPNAADDDTLWAAVAAALASNAAAIEAFLDSPPQTNEVRRAAGLIAAGHWLAARIGLPMVLSELGASAGLNTIWDRYALTLPGGVTLGPPSPALTLTPDWTGPLPPAAAPVIATRTGVDLNPIDLTDPAQRLRLRAYLWADQPRRRMLTDAAIAAAPPRPEAGDAIDWLAARLASPRRGHLHLIFHTVFWQYLPPEAQARGQALIENAGARARADAPLAWLACEDDGARPGAGLALRLWPGDQAIALGRADFHGRWLHWLAPPP